MLTGGLLNFFTLSLGGMDLISMPLMITVLRLQPQVSIEPGVVQIQSEM